jgi:hypothetical protein
LASNPLFPIASSILNDGIVRPILFLAAIPIVY